jgi:hypothetical protein
MSSVGTIIIKKPRAPEGSERKTFKNKTLDES